jgi:hypothetical protein
MNFEEFQNSRRRISTEEYRALMDLEKHEGPTTDEVYVYDNSWYIEIRPHPLGHEEFHVYTGNFNTLCISLDDAE